MTWAPLELQKAIYLIIASDDEMIDLLGGDSTTDSTSDKVFDHVPDNTPYPYVVIFNNDFEERGNHTFEGFTTEVQISVWYRPGARLTGRGNKGLQLIQERIDELLHKQSVCVEGWNTLQFRRSLISIEVEEDNVTRHGIQRFNVLLGET
jgi:hypothetical protein